MTVSNRLFAIACTVLLDVTLAGAAEPPAVTNVEPAWVQITNPTAAEVAGRFKSPPVEYANTVTWGWNGPMTEEVITRDLQTLYNRGLRIATIEAGYRMDNAPYLSEEWFKLIRFAAEQAKARGMRLIIIDEGKYPSGFVNGKYTTDRPDLRMQALVGLPPESVAGGQTYQRDVAANVISAIAFKSDNSAAIPLEINNGKIHWVAPEGEWQVRMAAHDFRTPQTRAVNDPSQAKTTLNSMGDLINPEATKLFIQWTHDQYKNHVGDLLGNAILAFRGDEPEMTGVPWTVAIADEFQKRKGYDIGKYWASFVLGGGGRGRGGGGPRMTEEQRRAKADYFDVWSELFAANFFDAQAEWCAANGMAATTHLNNDHNMPALVATTGDYFRALRKYQIPGVDVIWNQVWPGTVADFVKFPSSAAHLNGRSRALSESFAAYTPPAGIEESRFGVNYQLVRGINLFEFMFFMSSSNGAGGRGRGYMGDEKFPELAAYANRMSYLLAQGKPMAPIAIYVPTMSMWMGDNSGNASMMYIAQALSENQRDYDFADEAALSATMKLQGGEFTNLSGQKYRAVIVPSSTAISKAALDRLRAFARGGGKVIFVGNQPSLLVDKTFLYAGAVGDLSSALLEPSGEMNQNVLAALPKSDVILEQPNAWVKAMHRQWRDADLYFFFNESDQPQTVTSTVVGKGQAQLWDAYAASIAPMSVPTGADGWIKLPLDLEPHGARLIVIGPAVGMAGR